MDVSCASASRCVAVGQQGRILRTTGDAAAPLAWASVGLTDPQILSSVTCTGSRCLAVSTDRKIPATAVSQVFRSTDAGATWTAQDPLPPATLPGKTTRKTRSAYAIACDPGGGPVCYAAGITGGVWRSANGGVDWSPLDLDAAGSYTRLACAAANRCVAVAGQDVASPTTPTIAVLSGTTVDTSVQAPGAVAAGTAVACDTATRCMVTGAAGQYALLSLPGKTWSAVQTFPTKAKVPPTVVDLTCSAANTCDALATGIVLRTTSLSPSGTTWQRRPTGDAIPFNLKALSCAGTACVAAGDAATWFASGDLGFSWDAVNRVPAMDAVTCPVAGTCVGGGSDSVGVSRSDGALWSTPLYKDTGLDTKSVTCFDATTCFLFGRTGVLSTTDLRSFDGLFPPTSSPAGVSDGECLTQALCVGVSEGATFTTLDGAKSPWSQTSFPPAMPAAAACLPGSDPVTCLATTADGYVLRGTLTLDGNRPRWSWIYTTADADSALAGIGCSPAPVSCTAVGKAGEIWISDPADPTLMTWTQRQLLDDRIVDDRADFTAVTCPASGVCLIAGAHGGQPAIATTTDNWKTYTYDEPPTVIGAAPTIKGATCITVDRCVVVGTTTLTGQRSPGIAPAR